MLLKRQCNETIVHTTTTVVLIAHSIHGAQETAKNRKTKLLSPRQDSPPPTKFDLTNVSERVEAELHVAARSVPE